jgi:nitrile hydratase accessory protein
LRPRETQPVLPGQPSDDTGPVFAEPWQAQAFAIAVQLSEAGYFTWTEWAETLGVELRAMGEDDGTRYYEAWLRALERLTLSKGLTDVAALDLRTSAWADAYRRTPHGQPVELRAATVPSSPPINPS